MTRIKVKLTVGTFHTLQPDSKHASIFRDMFISVKETYTEWSNLYMTCNLYMALPQAILLIYTKSAGYHVDISLHYSINSMAFYQFCRLHGIEW